MTKGQAQVKEFMQFFGQPTPEKPIQVDEATAKLRARLILEEAFETITKGLGLKIDLYAETGSGWATVEEKSLTDWLNGSNIQFTKQKEVDLKETADGLADLAYVGEFGTAVALGIDLEPIQDEVHRSNMSKAWREGDLDKAKELHPEAKVEDYGGGLYRLVRPDGKIIKSPSYSPADISSLIEAQK